MWVSFIGVGALILFFCIVGIRSALANDVVVSAVAGVVSVVSPFMASPAKEEIKCLDFSWCRCAFGYSIFWHDLELVFAFSVLSDTNSAIGIFVVFVVVSTLSFVKALPFSFSLASGVDPIIEVG